MSAFACIQIAMYQQHLFVAVEKADFQGNAFAPYVSKTVKIRVTTAIPPLAGLINWRVKAVPYHGKQQEVARFVRAALETFQTLTCYTRSIATAFTGGGPSFFTTRRVVYMSPLGFLEARTEVLTRTQLSLRSRSLSCIDRWRGHTENICLLFIRQKSKCVSNFDPAC